MIAPITPKAFLEGNPNIRRLFPDVRAAEQSYFKKTGLFPIMHAVAIRNDLIEKEPSLPKAVFDMILGPRYTNLDTTVTAADGPTLVDESQDWLYPLVGIRWKLGFADQWSLVA